MNQALILGVRIDQVNLVEILSQIETWIQARTQRQIVTINAEFIVAAQKNPQFKQILNQAALAICDGSGPHWVALWCQRIFLPRVTGVEIVEALLKGRVKSAKIYVLGGLSGAAEKLIQEDGCGVIAGGQRGGRFNAHTGELDNNQTVIDDINQSHAAILLVGFGQVKQELWIAKNLSRLPHVTVAIGVGGSLDFLSGIVPRSPHWLRRLGLEWLYRLIRQPWRIKRIWNAVVYFPWLVVKEKFRYGH